MNLKKSVFTLMAAGTVLLGGAGVVSAQSVTNSGTGTVYVYTTGTFNAEFCNANFQFADVSLSSAHPNGTTNAHVDICYTDNQANRGVFRTYMSAGTFYDVNNNNNYIAASYVSPSYITNVGQGQWGAIPNVGHVGDIGGMKGAANYAGSNPNTDGYVNGAGNQGPWLGGDLSSPQYVGYGNAGFGTGGSMYLAYTGGNHDPRFDNGSVAPIDLTLTVPSTTVQGIYQSTFTLQVNLNQAP